MPIYTYNYIYYTITYMYIYIYIIYSAIYIGIGIYRYFCLFGLLIRWWWFHGLNDKEKCLDFTTWLPIYIEMYIHIFIHSKCKFNVNLYWIIENAIIIQILGI